MTGRYMPDNMLPLVISIASSSYHIQTIVTDMDTSCGDIVFWAYNGGVCLSKLVKIFQIRVIKTKKLHKMIVFFVNLAFDRGQIE